MSKQKSRRFAEGTTVDVSSSQEQIKRLLTQHGANQFVLAEGDDNGTLRGVVQFRIKGRMLKYECVYPSVEEVPPVPRSTRLDLREQWCTGWRDLEWKRRWRALLLILKAKLELVASGDTTFEREFLADIMLPDGSTVASQVLLAIESAYQTGQMPRLLPGDPRDR